MKSRAIYPHEIREMRRRLRLSQRQLADLIASEDDSLGTTQETVARWETGKHAPSPAAKAVLLRLVRKGDLTTRPPASDVIREYDRVIADAVAWRQRATNAGDVQGARTAETIIQICRATLATYDIHEPDDA